MANLSCLLGLHEWWYTTSHDLATGEATAQKVCERCGARGRAFDITPPNGERR